MYSPDKIRLINIYNAFKENDKRVKEERKEQEIRFREEYNARKDKEREEELKRKQQG